MILKEKHENVFKVSVRSLDNGKALKFCELFNGGGHSDAAGFEIYGDYQTVKNIILEKIKVM